MGVEWFELGVAALEVGVLEVREESMNSEK